VGRGHIDLRELKGTTETAPSDFLYGKNAPMVGVKLENGLFFYIFYDQECLRTHSRVCISFVGIWYHTGMVNIFPFYMEVFMKSDSPLPTTRERLHAKLDALLDECDLVADASAYGQTLNDMEEFFLFKGRKFLQETFQEKLQERVEQIETATETKQCPHCKKKRKRKTKKQKT
jgi:hypothetical protein